MAIATRRNELLEQLAVADTSYREVGKCHEESRAEFLSDFAPRCRGSNILYSYSRAF